MRKTLRINYLLHNSCELFNSGNFNFYKQSSCALLCAYMTVVDWNLSIIALLKF